MTDKAVIPHEETAGLIDRIPCGFVSFADDGTVGAVNATLLEMLGLERGNVVGRHIEKILTVGSRIFYQTHLFPLLRMHGHAEEIFIMLRAADGHDEAALLNAVRRQEGDEWLTHCIFMRVRERKKFEEALLRAKKEAEAAREKMDTHRKELELANAQLEQQALELELSQQQLNEHAVELEALNQALHEQAAELETQRTIAQDANQAKSAFLASMSHELRTPLNAIGGYVQLIEMGIHGAVTPAQADALAKVARSQRHLLRLINEVLNLAKIEAGSVNYEVRPIVLRDVVNAVFPMVEPQVQERGLTSEIDVSPELVALGDRDKTEQILLNLLSNAVKFTNAGGSISIVAGNDDESPGRVWLQVEDTGVGIPPDKLERVFDPFVQVDVSAARRAEGTGLGLAISRDLALGMKGQLSVESVLEHGSKFRLTLPAA
ncbi:MAG: ATP-binding protein [Gemmatimonadota bacterium]|nr:ATP-binding protein [Gemmatimonadota bacterium]